MIAPRIIPDAPPGDRSEITYSPAPSVETLPLANGKRFCRTCLATLPLSDFRPVGDGRRSNRCNACHSRIESERAKAVRKRVQRRELYRAWGALANAENRRLCIERFILGLLARFGGQEGLVAAWVDAHNVATACRRLRSVESMVRVMQWLESTTPKISDLDGDSLQAELDREIVSNVDFALRTRPELVKTVCVRKGFTLVPIK